VVLLSGWGGRLCAASMLLQQCLEWSFSRKCVSVSSTSANGPDNCKLWSWAVGPLSETDDSQLQHLLLLAVSESDLLLGLALGIR
jgi:hypothetical protein